MCSTHKCREFVVVPVAVKVEETPAAAGFAQLGVAKYERTDGGVSTERKK